MSTVAPTSTPRTTSARRDWWQEVAAGASLVVADLLAFSWIVMHQVSVFQHQHDDVGTNVNFFLPSDLAQPLQMWVWLLVVANGLVLCVRRRTRRAGVAVLLTAAALAAVVLAWATWAVMMFAAG